MPRVARTMAMALGLFGGVVASLGPEFAQQYRQRLGGAIDELRLVVSRFDEDASRSGETREGAIERLRRNPDLLAGRQGEAIQSHAERLARLERHRAELQGAGSFGRVIATARDADTDLARATYRDFEPAVPATQEGLVTGVLGFALAWLLARLVGAGGRRMLGIGRRRPGRRPGRELPREA